MQIEQPLPCVGFRQIAENAKLTRKSQILLGEPNNGTHSGCLSKTGANASRVMTVNVHPRVRCQYSRTPVVKATSPRALRRITTHSVGAEAS